MKMLPWAAAVLALSISATAVAAPVEITFSSPSPPKAHLNVQIFAPWVKQVNADGAGVLKVKFVPGRVLASHRNIYDRVTKNVVAIGWTIHSFIAGKFTKTNMVNLPLNFESSKEGTQALWSLYEKGMLASDYDEIRPLALFAFPPTRLHGKFALRKLDDLKGVKFATGGKILSEIVSALGATPISLIPPQVYQALSRGLVKGTASTWTVFPPYRFDEVTTHHIEPALGSSSGMLFMNKGVFAKLPAKARQVIEKNSGRGLSRDISLFWDRVNAGSRKRVSAKKGHVITPLSAADKARLARVLEPINDRWAKRTKGGEALLKAFRAEIARSRSM